MDLAIGQLLEQGTCPEDHNSECAWPRSDGENCGDSASHMALRRHESWDLRANDRRGSLDPPSRLKSHRIGELVPTRHVLAATGQ